MPAAHLPHGFQALNARRKQSRRIIFVIFQYVRWNLLPAGRQRLPTACGEARTRSAIIDIVSHHRGSFISNRAAQKTL
jgi:hypothetical protein